MGSGRRDNVKEKRVSSVKEIDMRGLFMPVIAVYEHPDEYLPDIRAAGSGGRAKSGGRMGVGGRMNNDRIAVPQTESRKETENS